MADIVTMDLTAAGLKLYGKVQAGLTTLTISRVAIGTGYLNADETVMDIAALKSEIDVTTRILDNEIIGNGQTKLSFRITGANADFYLREIGVMANDPDDGEILYCYCNYGDFADYVMTYGGSIPVTQEAAIYFSIGSAEKILVEFAKETAAVAYRDFEEHTGDTSNPHRVTAAQVFPDNSETLNAITAKNKEDYDGAVTASHTHENKSVIDKITDALITAWNNAVSHISNKANPHSVTKTQVGLGNVTNESKSTMFTNPTFTGTPRAPTPTATDNSTQIATTEFVQSIASDCKEEYGGAVTASHTHENKSVIDKITDALITAWNNAVSHISNTSNPHSVTKTQVGLGNVTNESKATMFTNPTFTGTPRAPTPTTADNSTQIATTAFVQAIAEQIKASLGNAYLGDTIDFLDVVIYRIQYGGHSEYEIYEIGCVGCRLQTGDYVSNSSVTYKEYGNRNYSAGNFVIGFNPSSVIVLPVTAVTLDNCLYIGEANSAYKTVSISSVTDWYSELDEHSDGSYVMYDRAEVRIYNN